MDASTSSRRRRLRGALVCALTGVALFAASTASGVVAIGEIHPVGEERLDTRTASLAPSVGQLEAVERLGATVRFNVGTTDANKPITQNPAHAASAARMNTPRA